MILNFFFDIVVYLFNFQLNLICIKLLLLSLLVCDYYYLFLRRKKIINILWMYRVVEAWKKTFGKRMILVIMFFITVVNWTFNQNVKNMNTYINVTFGEIKKIIFGWNIIYWGNDGSHWLYLEYTISIY